MSGFDALFGDVRSYRKLRRGHWELLQTAWGLRTWVRMDGCSSEWDGPVVPAYVRPLACEDYS